MEVMTHTIGGRVDKFCAVCGEACGHIVAALTKHNRITYVTCPRCQTRSRFDSKAPSVKVKGSNQKTAAYEGTSTYKVGQWITHQAYGEGQVTALIEPQKIDVLFADRLRRLIHARRVQNV